jgi:hypothetical protein
MDRGFQPCGACKCASAARKEAGFGRVWQGLGADLFGLIATFGEGNSMVSRGIARVLVCQSSISAGLFSFAVNHLGFLGESL